MPTVSDIRLMNTLVDNSVVVLADTMDERESLVVYKMKIFIKAMFHDPMCFFIHQAIVQCTDVLLVVNPHKTRNTMKVLMCTVYLNE